MSIQNKKIGILGNSVSLLVLPHRKAIDDKTYAEHLEDQGYSIINASKQSVMLYDVYRYLEDELIRYFPDYIVINMGIVEATLRARPRFLQNFFSENAWRNNIINISFLTMLQRGFRRVSKVFYRFVERILYALHIKWRWMSPRKFKFAIYDVLKILSTYTPAKKIIVLGMLPVSSELDRVSPGTKDSVVQYNNFMREESSRFERAIFVGMDDIFSSDEIKNATEDSIHLSALGHKRVSEHISNMIEGNN